MEPETPENRPADYGRKPSPLDRLQEIKLPLWVSLVLLLLLIIFFAWGRITAGTAERRLEAERQQLEQQVQAERAAMQRETQEMLGRELRELQNLFGNALAWSVRSAMMRGNLDEVDQYFTDLVKNPRVTLVVLSDNDGKVLRASDRKYLETPFTEHYPAELLKVEGVTVQPDEGKRQRIVLPIQGLTARLGTVLVVYTPGG